MSSREESQPRKKAKDNTKSKLRGWDPLSSDKCIFHDPIRDAPHNNAELTGARYRQVL